MCQVVQNKTICPLESTTDLTGMYCCNECYVLAGRSVDYSSGETLVCSLMLVFVCHVRSSREIVMCTSVCV